MSPITDHPLRYQLANELHARPFPSMTVPCTVVLSGDQAAQGGGQPRPERGSCPSDRASGPAWRPASAAGSDALLRQDRALYAEMGTAHRIRDLYRLLQRRRGERPFDPADFEVFPARLAERGTGPADHLGAGQRIVPQRAGRRRGDGKARYLVRRRKPGGIVGAGRRGGRRR